MDMRHTLALANAIYTAGAAEIFEFSFSSLTTGWEFSLTNFKPATSIKTHTFQEVVDFSFTKD